MTYIETDSESTQQVPAGMGEAMLAAAHALLNSERSTDLEDLLISTCLEVLEAGAASTSAICDQVNEIWPAARVVEGAVEDALKEAKDLNLVVRFPTSSGDDWALSTTGLAEIDATRSWLDASIERLARQIADRAVEDFGFLSDEVSFNWARLLLRLFTDEIARSASTYAGEIARGAAGSVRPVVLDGNSMLRRLDQVSLAEGPRDFLKACLLASVDETDPFGNELLGQVATSCVLHAVAAGRGTAAALDDMGSLVGRRLVVDTPLLVNMLGSRRQVAQSWKLLRNAVAQGLEVLVPEHVLEELADVITRVSEDHMPNLSAPIARGLAEQLYASIVNDQVVELYFDGLEDGSYKSWSDFESRARNIRAELLGAGVIVRDHGNKNRDNVTWASVTLKESLEATGSRRSSKAIARDAESIELVWRARRRHERKPTGYWPGGWLLTSDKHISSAYQRLNRDDNEPLTLNLAQLSVLLTKAAPPTEIGDLVEAAASFMRQETMLKIATKYPPAIALTLARSLGAEYGSATDLRLAQLYSVGELLEQNAAGETVSGESIASDLAVKRAGRLAAAGIQQVDLATLERARFKQAVTDANVIVGAAEQAKSKAERRADGLEARVSIAHRSAVVASASTLILVFAVVAMLWSLWWLAIGLLITFVAFVALGRDWATKPSARLRNLFWSLLGFIGGLVELLLALT